MSTSVPLVSTSCESTYLMVTLRRFFRPACFRASLTDL
ncbi:Uncharacterised protein [Vibrio cholerae]|nr:Uncharacterised protein [Vibrio cholerae]